MIDDRAYDELLAGFAPADPALLARRQLLRRRDSKFVLPVSALEQVLRPLVGQYRLLRAAGRAVASYRTLYFDTPELRCFHDHRRGCRPRYKVRIRHYPERQVSFLEVKSKRSELMTAKHRLPRPYGDNSLDPAGLQFIASHCDVPTAALTEQLWTNFRRVTLIGVATTERITVDTHLELVDGSQRELLAGAVIMEVKQAPFSARSPVMLSLRRAGYRRVPASKYCTANALLRRGLRINRLLPAVRRLEETR